MEPLATHISQQYDAELEDIRTRVLAMGGLVESQIEQAIAALVRGDIPLGEAVVMNDYKVNRMEVMLDDECTQIIARRQPAAGDLRLVIAVIKTITDLERIGDEAEKIGRMAVRLAAAERPKNNYFELHTLGDHARQMVHDALDSFARLDIEAAFRVAREDQQLDKEYGGVLRTNLEGYFFCGRAAGRAIAARDCWLCQCVRNSTARQPSTSNACVSRSSLLSALIPVRCAEAAVQVDPISSRGTSASMFR